MFDHVSRLTPRSLLLQNRFLLGPGELEALHRAAGMSLWELLSPLLKDGGKLCVGWGSAILLGNSSGYKEEPWCSVSAVLGKAALWAGQGLRWLGDLPGACSILSYSSYCWEIIVPKFYVILRKTIQWSDIIAWSQQTGVNNVTTRLYPAGSTLMWYLPPRLMSFRSTGLKYLSLLGLMLWYLSRQRSFVKNKNTEKSIIVFLSSFAHL